MKKNLFLLSTALILAISSYAENVTLTLYADGCSAPNVITCSAGQKLRINAVDDTYGYHFAQWTDGSTTNPRVVTMNSNATYTAQFSNLYTITTAVNDSIRGIIKGDTTVEYMETISILAIPNYGYHFTRWNDGNTNNPRQIQVTSDRTYTAQFTKNTYSINQIAINGSILGLSSSNYLDTVSLAAISNYGYHFTHWSDGYTDNPRSFVLTKDTTFEALFAKNVYSISAAVNDTTRGVVKGDTTVEYMETVSISATPNYGYHFTQWNDGNTNNPRQIQVTSDQTYTAQFDKNQYSVSTTKGANIASIQGSGKYYYLDEIVLSAIANSNYQFDHWSDGNSDNPRTLIVTQDTSLIAYSSKIRGGKCGDFLTWLYNNGTLVISGTGAMYNYAQGTASWAPLFKDSITNMVINNGCTSIGNNAFYGLQNRAFTSLVLPQSVETIGAYAFANCNRLTSISLPVSLLEISNYAFSGCISVDNITSLATTRPDIYENTFKDVSSYAYLYVPCDYKRSYQLNAYWNRFDLKCIGAEETIVTNDNVTVIPNENDAAFTWPTNTQAASYSLQITKDGVVFCTLTFNSLGQLTGLAFAPGRGTAMEATEQAAIQSGNGFTFTVTGLNSASIYAFNMDVKDNGNKTLKSYTGTFQTKGTIITDLDNQLYDSPADRFTKIIKDGHLLIQREGKTYNAQGAEL